MRSQAGAASVSNRSNINPTAILAGVIAAFLASLLATALMAIVIFLTSITEHYTGLALYYLGIIALGIGGAIAAQRASSAGWLHGGIAGLCYVFLALIFSATILPGESIPMLISIQRLALGFVVGAIGGVLGVNLRG